MLAFLHISVLVNICSAEDSSVILTTNVNCCYKDIKKKIRFPFSFVVLDLFEPQYIARSLSYFLPFSSLSCRAALTTFKHVEN